MLEKYLVRQQNKRIIVLFGLITSFFTKNNQADWLIS